MNIAKYFGGLLVLLWLLTGCSTITSSDETVDDKVNGLTTVLQTVMNDKIPAALLKESQAVAVASVNKGGLVVALEVGKGFMSVREGQQWSNPIFIELASASFGFQAGLETKKIVLVFTNREAADNLLAGQLKLGVGLDLSVGPLATEVSTNTVFDKDVYSYSDGLGLFAGVSLKGASLAPDEYTNEQLYGEVVSADDILTGKAVTNSFAVKELRALLRDRTDI